MEFIQQQPTLMPETDPKAEMTVVDTVHSAETFGDSKKDVTEVGMSNQRKRRAQRMARRPQRLALGPASDHAAEIARAIQLVEAKNGSIYEAVLEGNKDVGQKSTSITTQGTDNVQSNQGSSTAVHADITAAIDDNNTGSLPEDEAGCIAANNDQNTEDRAKSEVKSMISGEGDHSKSGVNFSSETAPAEDQCGLEATRPHRKADLTEITKVQAASEPVLQADANSVNSQTPTNTELDRPEVGEANLPESTSGEVNVSEDALFGSSVNKSETIEKLSSQMVEDGTISIKPG